MDVSQEQRQTGAGKEAVCLPEIREQRESSRSDIRGRKLRGAFAQHRIEGLVKCRHSGNDRGWPKNLGAVRRGKKWLREGAGQQFRFSLVRQTSALRQQDHAQPEQRQAPGRHQQFELRFRAANSTSWPSSPAPSGLNYAFIIGPNYQDKPLLVVNWYVPAPAPTQVSPGLGGHVNTLTPSLQVAPETDCCPPR